MDIVSTCPLRVASVVWQPRPGTWALTSVIKATYRLQPGLSPLAEVQETPRVEDNHWDDNPGRSLYAASDLAPFKRRPEVMLVGHAFAPGGQPARSLVARLLVAEVDKAIEVWCDRMFAQDGRLLEGPRFTKVSLRWERAAGGPGTWNPVGMRFDATPDIYGAVPVPNLQPPGSHVAWRGDTFAPTGFGPVASSWPSRGGTALGGWSLARWFEGPLPEGLDAGWFNAAPPDQRVQELRADERIVLENLHPEHARLVTNLAGVKPRAVVERATGEREEVRLLADTLWIDTDRALCTLVWRGSIGLRYPKEAGRVVVWAEGEGAGAARSAETTQKQKERQGGGEDDVDTIRMAPPGAAGHGARGEERERRKDSKPVWRTMQLPLDVASGPVLPFREGPRSPTLEPSPLIAPPGERSAEMPAPVRSDAGQTLSAPLMATSVQVMPFRSQMGAAAATTPDVNAGAGPSAVVSAIPVVAVHAPEPYAERAMAPLPPARIEAAPQGEQASASPPVTPASPAPPIAQRAAPSPAEFPLELCAAITASIARRRVEAKEILEKHELTQDAWAAIERHWAEAIRTDIARGKQELLRRFDASYVDQIEKERGPIQPNEYAQLTVAVERGQVDQILRDLGIPKGALMRMERVWLKRMAADPGLDERVREALSALRES